MNKKELKYFHGDPIYRIWTRLVSCVMHYVRRRSQRFFLLFSVSGIFPRKADNIILLGSEYTINPQNLIKFVVAIFQKISIQFFMWSALNFKDRTKTKILASNICERTLYIEFKRDWSDGSGPTSGDWKKF